ncbi:MAG: Alkaline phosphatase synthesis transcriptional regulatory protein PhoP [Elusimicrobia bacterium]|nr:Alkaline phosphatase synthesis transcriptional regulatory protein PhoP [Elusimicrobiota bacterium]
MGLFKNTKQKILVVEDEPDIADGLKLRLDMAGYDVVLAADGQDGILKAKNEKPDLVVLDLMIPKMDGYEVCRILRSSAFTKTTPILILTALQMVGDIDKAFEVGANDYLSKPFTNERLLAKITKLLNK